MQPRKDHQLLTSIKWLFVSGTIATMVWLWGWFSNQTIQNVQKNQANTSGTTQANVVVLGADGQRVSSPTTVTLNNVTPPSSANQQVVITTNRNSNPFTSTGSSRP
jgi:hypothetical protein